MSRKTACKLFKAFLSGEKFSAKALAIDLGTEESNVREWFYEMEKHKLIRIVGNVERPPGTGRGLNKTNLYQLNQDLK